MALEGKRNPETDIELARGTQAGRMVEDHIKMTRFCGGRTPSMLSGGLAFLVAVFLSIHWTIVSAAPTRDQIRAALVYKFAQFVRWPADDGASDSTFVVGLLGNDGIRPVLAEFLKTKSLHGRRFEVRPYKRPEEVRGCRILVVDVLESRQAIVLQALARKGLLTIGEGAPFARHGGVIAVLLDVDQVKFDLNLAAADEAGLTFDPTLLGLAREAGRW